MNQERIQPSAEELVLCSDASIACETYLFEPSAEEARLGFLFAAGETEDRNGIGKPLLDSIIAAVQKEYYRDPSRSPATSFELALHQANLILHDTAEAGTRDWMGHFHVAIGVLAGSQLHISVAGAGTVFLARKSVVTNISQGLSHFPITDPLKTFSQVASGEVIARDTLFFTSSTFDSVFRSTDVGRFTLEHSASTIASRLEQLYLDQDHKVPLSATVVTLLPQYIANPKQEAYTKRSAEPVTQASTPIQPRTPLVVKRTLPQQLFLFVKIAWQALSHAIKNWIWPSGKAIVQASKQAKSKVHTISLPKLSVRSTMSGVRSLPISSKLFAIIAIILLVALGASIILLRHKQASDQAIQAASEQLHQAQTKLEAAKTALIYDNQEQAKGLLSDAQTIADQLAKGSLYTKEVQTLEENIKTENDRIQKIFRADNTTSHNLGTFSSVINGKPNRIFFVDGAIYTANPNTNTIAKMTLDGKATAVHQTTSGIGFITSGTMQSSDKTILFNTDPIGLALFDTKDSTLSPQTITFPAPKPVITDLAVFGNRLYIYDATQQNIFSYNKTLRGFVNASAWITDATANKSNIVSIAIDGNIYALSNDGKITKYFRGAPSTDFAQPTVNPPLTTATRLYTTDTMQNLYLLDPQNKRVVVLSKKGALLRQIYIDTASTLADVTISPDETHLYALDGANVIDVSLVDQATASPSTSPKP